MASVDDVIGAIEKFQLDLIEKQWSDDIWANEFTVSPEDITEEFADRFSNLSYCDIVQVIEQADKIIHFWLKNQMDVSGTGPSWTLLQGVDYRKLLAVLFFYISKGHLNNQDVTAVNICVRATNFYFTLLIIPGSDVFKIFHVTLFGKALETFTLHKYLEITTGKKIKKRRDTSRNEGMSSDEEFFEIDETLTFSQQQQVVKLLNILLSSFQQLIKKFSFKKYPEALNMCLSVLAELTRVEKSCLQDFSTNSTSTSLASLSRNAYLTLRDFCSDTQGRVPEIIRLVLFYLMPNLSSVGGISNPDINSICQKELTNIRSVTVSFIINNIVPLGKDSYLGLKILIQQLCYNMIDRADYRSRATDMVVALLTKIPMDLYYIILKWIFRLSMTEGAHHRVISLELLSKLIFIKPGTNEVSKLTESQCHQVDSQLQNVTTSRSEVLQKSETSSTVSLSTEPVVSFSRPLNYVPLEYRKVMFAIIIDRIRDEACIVKTRALTLLSELIGNKTSTALKTILKEVFLTPYLNTTSIKLNNHEQENDFLKWKTFVCLLDKIQEDEVAKNMFPGGRVIVSKVFEKCLDVRVNVRKAALQVILSLFKFSPKWMTIEALQLFGRHCRDPALSIRKDMLNSLTDLMLFFPDHDSLMELWVEEVVPIIMDREVRVQQQALQIFTNIILSKITSFKNTRQPSDELPWKLLTKIAEQNKRSFLLTACTLWSENGKLTQSLINTLKTHVGTTNDGPAWVFLSCISEYFDIEKPEFVMKYYLDVVSQESGDLNTSYLALHTLSTSWENLPRDKKETLQMEMFSKLKSFSVCPTFVGLIVEITAGITVFLAEDELAGKKEVAKWGIEMIKDCEKHLEGCLRPLNEMELGCSGCVNILALLGALTGLCPNKINHPTFLLLYNFLMNSNHRNTSFDRKMRAMTVIALSKMSLHCDVFARSLVAGLAQLLSQSDDPILLNNVIVAIADIGENYANLIEPLIPFICVCLKSKHKRLKEITLILLIELLQEDYLKARGAVVFHLLSMVNDPDPWLVNIVKFYFTSTLLPRNPYKMYQLFLPGMFHFNNYTNHPDYPRVEMMDAEFRAFDLSGPENHDKRMNIYQFMLSNIPEMVKMKCLHFICTAVLNSVADNIISLKSRNGEQLLYDALCVLLTPEIKIEFNELVKKKNEDGEEEEEEKQNPLYKLGKQMFTAAQKKEIIEIIIPICCKLKKKLLMENKKLLPYLRKFVRELVKDYKNEINEIFKEDKQFGIEILHELDKISNATEEEEEEEEEDEEEEEEVQPPGFTVLRKSGGDLPIIPEQNSEEKNTSKDQNVAPLKEAVVSLERLNFLEMQNIRSRENLPANEKITCLKNSVVKFQGLSSSRIQNAENMAVNENSMNLKKASVTVERLSPCRIQSIQSSLVDKPVRVERPSVIHRIESTRNPPSQIIAETNDQNMDKVPNTELRELEQGLDPLAYIPVKNLLAPLKPLSPEGVKALESGAGVILDARFREGLRNSQVEENRMEKAMREIIMPPPVKVILYKKDSTKSYTNKTPTTPMGVDYRARGRKGVLTSTPLIQAEERSEFDMDLSAVVDESEE